MKTYKIPIQIIPPNIEIMLGIASIKTEYYTVKAINKEEAKKLALKQYHRASNTN